MVLHILVDRAELNVCKSVETTLLVRNRGKERASSSVGGLEEKP